MTAQAEQGSRSVSKGLKRCIQLSTVLREQAKERRKEKEVRYALAIYTCRHPVTCGPKRRGPGIKFVTVCAFTPRYDKELRLKV